MIEIGLITSENKPNTIGVQEWPKDLSDFTFYNSQVEKVLMEERPFTKTNIAKDTCDVIAYPIHRGSYFTMLASESVLGREWNSPEEDSAWENL